MTREFSGKSPSVEGVEKEYFQKILSTEGVLHTNTQPNTPPNNSYAPITTTLTLPAYAHSHSPTLCLTTHPSHCPLPCSQFTVAPVALTDTPSVGVCGVLLRTYADGLTVCPVMVYSRARARYIYIYTGYTGLTVI